MTAIAPGTVIDGTPEEVEAVLRGAPMATTLFDKSGGVWQLWRLSSGEWFTPMFAEGLPTSYVAAQGAPLTVIRWGSELPPPVDVQSVVLEAVVRDRLSIAEVLGGIVGASAVTNLWSASAEVDRRNRAAGGDPA